MKRETFIASVEQELGRMGYKPTSYRWMPKGAGLVFIVNGAFRDLPVRVGMKHTELHRWLGRAAGWADIMGLTPGEVA